MSDVELREAARELHAWPQNLYSAVWSGKLRARQDSAGRWRISREDLEAFKRKRAGRTRKKKIS